MKTTVEEFMALPSSPAAVPQELRHGELIQTPPVKHLYTRAQRSLILALQRALDGRYLVEKEFPFRPLPQYEVWVADVALVDSVRDQDTPDNDYFRGVPEIVIEVLSPSNTASEMLEREAICLHNGAREFWLCDPLQRSLKVTTVAGQTRIFGIGDTLQMTGFGQPIVLADLFLTSPPPKS